ncbi:hypothetical protein GO491_05005 [Flavobacteriaceae bacterium Ap0902]|nr:hypothetical protein [Flavobacteriaceae bacterium Ap0902]
MAIPTNITREHVLRAIQRVDREGIPPRRNSRKWFLEYDKELYPVKLLISWANEFANGEELDSDPNVFILDMARKYLESLDFTIVNIALTKH